MNQSFAPLDSLLLTVVLVTLAVGLPILVVLSTHFLWDRKLNLGRSKELEKLIWQLHRIASAMEHQMNRIDCGGKRRDVNGSCGADIRTSLCALQ